MEAVNAALCRTSETKGISLNGHGFNVKPATILRIPHETLIKVIGNMSHRWRYIPDDKIAYSIPYENGKPKDPKWRVKSGGWISVLDIIKSVLGNWDKIDVYGIKLTPPNLYEAARKVADHLSVFGWEEQVDGVLALVAVAATDPLWCSLVLGDPVAIKVRSGALGVFMRGANDQLIHQWQYHKGSNWSLPLGLGMQFRGTPAVVLASNGAMAVFGHGVRGDLQHVWQKAEGGQWSKPVSLGGRIVGSPSAVVTPSGAIAVFARGQGGDLQHVWQHGPLSGWSGWLSMGGQISGDPTAIVNGNGAVTVFARGAASGDLQRLHQDCAGCGWGGWTSAGGVTGADPHAVATPDGGWSAFTRGTDDGLWTAWLGPRGSGWASLGGDWIQPERPTALWLPSGVGAAFMRGGDGALWHAWQWAPGSGWTGWVSLGGSLAGRADVVTVSSGAMVAFARSSDSRLVHAWQPSAGSGWTGWVPVR